jgi:tRNA A-37 threonylcarbamoyl transferase component Bud32
MSAPTFRDTKRVLAGRITWHLSADAVDPKMFGIVEDPEHYFPALPAGLPRGQGATTTAKAYSFFLKRYNHHRDRLIKSLKNVFRTAPARHAFLMGRASSRLGIRTPRPLAVGVERAGRILRRAYLITEVIEQPQILREWNGDRSFAARETAAILATLHGAGYVHGDLNTSNLVFGAAGNLYLVDLDTMRFIGSVSQDQALRELARFSREALKHPKISRADRVRFLQEYCRLRAIKEWRICLEEIEKLNQLEQKRLERKLAGPRSLELL